MTVLELPPAETDNPPAADDFTCTVVEWCGLPGGHSGWHRKGAKDAPKETKPRGRPAGSKNKPKAPARRQAASPMPGVLALVWAQAGAAIEAFAPTDAAQPVGRVMQFQAIDAGVRLDRILSTVPAYKALLARAGGKKSEDIAALLAGPILAGVMAVDERAREALWPMFSSIVAASAVSVAKAQREQMEAMQQVEGYEQEVAELLLHLQETLFRPPEGHDDEPQ